MSRNDVNESQAPLFSLVDFYLPSQAAGLEEIKEKAAQAALDAVVLAVEDGAWAPDMDALEALNAAGGPVLLVAPVIRGIGYRYLFLADGLGSQKEALDAAGSAALVEESAISMGGLALPVSPRQEAPSQAMWHAPAMHQPLGVIGLTIPGSCLGRDLDFEDAAIAGLPIMGATGPFGGLDDLGRYATALSSSWRNAPAGGRLKALAAALQEGPFFGVEIAEVEAEKPAEAPRRRGRARRRRPRREEA